MARRRGGGRPKGGVGPMQFGRSTIGWGASASPAARRMGAVYGAIPRSAAAGTLPASRKGPTSAGITGAYRTILNPWGNNIPQARKQLGLSSTGGRRMNTQSPEEIRIDYPANDPRQWPIAGGKIVQFAQAAKANFNNSVVDRAFARAGYPLVQSYPTFTGTDAQYADVQNVGGTWF